MAMNRRGVFYSMMALVIVGILLIAYKPQIAEMSINKHAMEESRVEVADNLIRNINDAFMARMVAVSTYRALNSMALYAGTAGAIEDWKLETIFQRVMLFGNITVNRKIDQDIPIKMMENNTLYDAIGRLEDSVWDGLTITLDFNKSSLSAEVFQDNNTGPEYVMVNLSASYKVDAGTASWNINKNWSVLVPISGLFDPLWLIYENWRHPITFADYTVDYNEDWTSLWKFIDNVDYREQSYGPSYLMRMTGDRNASSCCGIESAVNPQLLNLSKEYNRTYIDFCWSSKRCSPFGINKTLYELKNITTHECGTKFYGFKLDARHYVQTGGQGGNGSIGSSPTGIPTIVMAQCEINESWQSCTNAQWLANISRVRAKCTHTNGYDKITRLGFKLMNEYDSTTFFDTPTSSYDSDGIWVYDNNDIVINNSGYWSLTTDCEDVAGLNDTRVTEWFVPWGWFNITWFYDENGTLKANVSCVGGECGELELWFDNPKSVTDNFSDASMIHSMKNLTLTAGAVNLTKDGEGFFKRGVLNSTNLLNGLLAVSITSFNATTPSIPVGTQLRIQFSQTNITWVNSSGQEGWNTLLTGQNNINLSILKWSGDKFYYRMEFNSTGTATPNLDAVELGYYAST